MAIDQKLKKLQEWRSESQNYRKEYESTWADNLKLIKGVFSNEENWRSNVRRRTKTFFRKIWSTMWRMIASFYNALMRDIDNFKIEGRDSITDPPKAEVLQEMVKYRRDQMYRTQNLFKKWIWGFQDIFAYGACFAKLSWEFNEFGQDRPKYTSYPPEQVGLDWAAETEEDMRYMYFQNYMTEDEMKELGYKNISQIKQTSLPNNLLRNARKHGRADPIQDPGEREYPKPGSVYDSQGDYLTQRYITREWYYREGGVTYWCVTGDDEKVFLMDEEESPYGFEFPLVMGECLTVAHELVGEGFPEPLKAPQESINYFINKRKDNIAQSLSKHAVVSRFGNVDLQSLSQRRTSGITLADDPNAIQWEDIPDVTQSAYLEAEVDANQMEEMSGVVKAKMGMERAEKATVAQINFSEANAKIDLYIAIVAETFIRRFYQKLAIFIQRFETDETVFRIANRSLRTNGIAGRPYLGPDIYDLDFDADCVVYVGLGTVGRDLELRQTFLAMDRALQSNQVMLGLAQSGLIPRQGIKLFDPSAFMEDLLPKLGKKDIQKYFFSIPQRQAQAAALLQNRSRGGATGTGEIPEENALQAGGLGGL